MSGTTDDTIEQVLEAVCRGHGVPRYTNNVRQVEAFYARLGFHRYTDNGQTLCRVLGEPCHRNPTCLALQELVVHSQRTFRGRKNSKALIPDVGLLWEKATGFVRRYGESFPSTGSPDSLGIELDWKRRDFQERIVSYILMLEGEIEREKTHQAPKVRKGRAFKGLNGQRRERGPYMAKRKQAEMLRTAESSQREDESISVVSSRPRQAIEWSWVRPNPDQSSERPAAVLLALLGQKTAGYGI